MDLFAVVAAERRALAAQLADLTPAQQGTPSLCHRWTVHDVLAHLVLPLQVGVPRFLVAMVAARGDFDRANERLTARQARRSFPELLELLDRGAGSRFTPPGAGVDAPLTDVLVHGIDIRSPLGLDHEPPPDALRAALAWVTTERGAVLPRGATAGLQLEATDLGWAHGTGPVLRGPGDALLAALTGRAVALDRLTGPGVAVLRDRLPSPAATRGR